MTATGVAEVDPRFEARRAAVERDGRRRRRLQLVLVVAAVVAALGFYGITRSALLDVDHVRVVGAPITGSPSVVDASGIVARSQLFDLDAANVERRLERLPWVRSARVARAWPGTVRISIVERRPVAGVEAAGGGWFLVDDAGRLLARSDEPSPDLVVLDGLAADAQPGQVLVELAAGATGLIQRFGPRTADRVERIRFVGDREIELILSPSPFPEGTPEDLAKTPVVVRFGTLERASDKLVDLEALLEQVEQLCIVRIDVKVIRSPTPLRNSSMIGCPQ